MWMILLSLPCHTSYKNSEINLLLQRLTTAGFTINNQKSQLTPVTAIDYLGLRINFEKRYFTLDRKHITTFIKLANTDLTTLSGRQQRSVRGFLSFILSTTAHQYAFINAPLPHLTALLQGIQHLAGFQIQFRPPRKPPFVYVDATPSQLGILDMKTRQAMAIPHNGFQAHNELMALLLAISLYGQHRRYITDVSASLCLQKRSKFAFIPKVILQSLNPRNFYVSTSRNLADPVSRGPPGVYFMY